MLRVVKAALLLSLVQGCGGTEPRNEGTPSLLGRAVPPAGVPALLEIDEVTRVAHMLDRNGPVEAVAHPETFVEVNGQIRQWIKYYSTRGRSLQDSFARGLPYKPLVEKILARHGVPREFYYLAILESGFINHAVSRARAVGIWQFVRPTAVRYGLKCNNYVDERRDVIRSTKAAARYLRDLHKHFDSWYLVLAAYNAGDARIDSAVRRGKTRDFWELAEKGGLPGETLHFVPKFLATVLLGNEPAKYGMRVLPTAPPIAMLEAVRIPPSIKIERIAAAAKLSVREVKRFNPQLLKGVTPPTGSYHIWVPRSNATHLVRTWPTYAAVQPGDDGLM